MLILKSPLRLQSLSSFPISSDWLGEKIRGSYELMCADVTAQELLYMTMFEPEVYIGMEKGPSVSVKNTFRVDNQVKLEIVNQFLNRILLYGTERFTYQDEVFVASVLQKMGIMDVKKFMRQIKAHKDRDGLFAELVSRYFTFGREVLRHTEELLRERGLGDSGEDMAWNNSRNAGWFLQDEIFRRLGTAECDSILYNYTHRIPAENDVVKSIQPASWLEQADEIQLMQMKDVVPHQAAPAVWLVYCRYETEPMMPQGLARENIIRRIAAAVLENLIRRLDYETARRPSGKRQAWRNYMRVVCGSAAEVTERFWAYQLFGTAGHIPSEQYHQEIMRLYREELRLIRMFPSEADEELPMESGEVPLAQDINFLEQINRHNLEIKQLLESQNAMPESPKKISADKAQIRESALKALERPEEALREVFESSAAPVFETAVQQEKMQLIHYSEEKLRREVLDEMQEQVEKAPAGAARTQVTQQQVTQRQLEELKRELTRHSEEQMAKTVRRSLDAQMRVITDKVYGELERRLKNEQRRRGI